MLLTKALGLQFAAAMLLALGVAGTAAPAEPAPAANAEESYEPHPGDKLFFRVEEDPASGRTGDEVFVVSALGTLQFPVTRGADAAVTVNVKGKTLGQIKEEVKKKLDEDYYVDAHIRLTLKDQTQRPGKVLFTGAVKANVLQLIPGQTVTIYEAIAQVGTSEFANLKKVILNRIDPSTQKIKVLTVDIDLIRKDRTKDLPLQDGDRIEVKEKGLIY